MTCVPFVQIETSPSNVDTAYEQFPDSLEALRLGDPVKIARGKHAGKTGRIRVFEGKFVRVQEDISLIDVSLERTIWINLLMRRTASCQER